MAPCLPRGRRVAARAPRAFVIVALLFIQTVAAQQPNGDIGLYVQFRQGGPYPIVATCPNNGTLTILVTGPAGSPFAIVSGPINPGAATMFGADLVDVGTPPFFQDVTIVVDGTQPGSPPALHIPASGVAALTAQIPPNQAFPVPPMQAAVADPNLPSGFGLTAATAITFAPSKSILFIQGDWDPGVGATCRISDPGPFGFSMLASLLLTAGFNGASEVVDSSVTVTAQLLAPHGIVVLGSNRRAFATVEVDAIEAFVRGGGGLVSYSDSTFGPGSTASDNQVLSRFGLLMCPDNFGGPVFTNAFIPHPISAGVASVGAEGVGLVEVVGNGIDTITSVCPCAAGSGPCAPFPAVAPSGSANPVYAACAAVNAGTGRVVATFDRNTFFNPPGYGSSLADAANCAYAMNLFLWAGGY